MIVGALVTELPFGKQWFEHNPWMTGRIGLVVHVDFTQKTRKLTVLWDDGKIMTTHEQNVQEIYD